MLKKIAILLAIIMAVSFISHKVNPIVEEETERVWITADSKAYAKDLLHAWADTNYVCLNKLWTKESNWRPDAYNKVKVMGKNAGGIPQLLGMSPKTPAPIQIDRGLAYIKYRYGTPCKAWRHYQKKGWY